jgi:hypothetical protein
MRPPIGLREPLIASCDATKYAADDYECDLRRIEKIDSISSEPTFGADYSGPADECQALSDDLYPSIQPIHLDGVSYIFSL